MQIYETQRTLAHRQFGDVVKDSAIVGLVCGYPLKLRLEIADGSILDIHLSPSGKYSYHWERRLINGSLYRHDNAPHKSWRRIGSFPKHFHNGSETHVTESHLDDDPLVALDQVLQFVREKLSGHPRHL